MSALWKLSLTEYGVTPTAGGARVFARLTRPLEKIESAGHYVGACRRLQHLCSLPLSGFERIDGRLVAVGWNFEKPTDWVSSGLERFVDYWKLAATRPWAIESPYNPDPVDAYRAMRAGLPPWVCSALAGVGGVYGRSDGIPYISRRRRQRLIRAARAARRTSIKNASDWSLGALAALGRLCPELQRVAVEFTTRSRRVDGFWRQRDIDWSAVARVQQQLLSDRSGRVRVAWATGKRQQLLFQAVNPSFSLTLPEWISPSYPRLSWSQACHLARGVSPSELSGGLTRREAHRWLTENPGTSDVAWLLGQHGLGAHAPAIVEIPVARWLIDVKRRGDWGALSKERHARFGAQTFTFSLLARLDEIHEEHLVHGPRTSVELVFRRAAEEHAGIHAFRDSREIVSRLPESWPALIEGMRLLSTPSEMVARGEAHHHCLALWVNEIRRGNFWVLSIEADETSTALLDRQRRIVQHYGPFNSSPTAACASLLAQWLLLDELWLPPSVPTSNAQELPF